ncbi:MAG: HAD family hydrolase, partial [Pseudomonadales bacterium]|nr:HAD family hydrolase [Pseudomonadales bacterium]
MIRVIAFDLDDTLWDSWEVLTRAEEILQEWLTRQVPQLGYSVSEMRKLRSEILAEDAELVHYITELRRRIIERAMCLSGIPQPDAGNLSRDAMDVFLAARNEIELAPETIDTLTHLSRRYTL